MRSMTTIYVVVKDILDGDFGEATEDVLVSLDTESLAFSSLTEAERHREEIIKQILEEHNETEESCPVTRKRGHVYLWDEAECYRITPITLIQQL